MPCLPSRSIKKAVALGRGGGTITPRQMQTTPFTPRQMQRRASLRRRANLSEWAPSANVHLAAATCQLANAREKVVSDPFRLTSHPFFTTNY